jgi:Icc-related predicted phosphoesterase
MMNSESTITIVCISDTHGRILPEIPGGDILIHAGDLTGSGKLNQVERALLAIDGLPHRHKVVIAGNHDWAFQLEPNEIFKERESKIIPPGITYLQDSGVIIEDLMFWGTPWQPEFHNWAFNLPRGKKLREKWGLIPLDTDVLITHGPPYCILDGTIDGRSVGCPDLLARTTEIEPILHVFGHIHESNGYEIVGATTYVNAAICTAEDYKPSQSPIVVKIRDKKVIKVTRYPS